MKLAHCWPPSLQEQPPESEYSGPGKSFFLSPIWVNTYLAFWTEDKYFATLFRTDAQDSICGFLSVGRVKSRLGVRYNSLALNEATDSSLNNISVEVNGLIGSASLIPLPMAQNIADHSSGGFEALFKVLDARKDWDELRITALETADFESIHRALPLFGLTTSFLQEKTSYAVSLNLIRDQFHGDYLSSRSANTRSQLRRARKQVEMKYGACLIEPATSIDVAYEWFEALGQLHIKQWGAKGIKSGFFEKKFTDFQRALIQATIAQDALQLLRFSAGEKVLAYLFNFQVDGHVYFNMSGIDYDGTSEFKPGLLAHWFAIEYNLQQGQHTYDFLVGTNRYKESLSTQQTVLRSMIVRRKRWYFTLEHLLRQLRSLIK